MLLDAKWMHGSMHGVSADLTQMSRPLDEAPKTPGSLLNLPPAGSGPSGRPVAVDPCSHKEGRLERRTAPA